MTIGALVTTATASSRDGTYGLVRSFHRVLPEAEVVVVTAGGAGIADLDVTVVPTQQLDAECGLLIAETLDPDQQVAVGVPFALARATAEHGAAVYVAPGNLLVEPPDELDEVLGEKPLALVSPVVSWERYSATPTVQRAGRQGPAISDRVIAARHDAGEALQLWQRTMTETFFDPVQRRPLDLHVALVSSLLGRFDVGVAGASTLINWVDFAAVESQRAIGPRCSIVQADEMWELGRTAHAAGGDDLEVAWQLLVDNVHDSRPLEPLVELIAEAVASCPIHLREALALEAFCREVRRAADPTGARWPTGRGREFNAWLHQRNAAGVTRLADLYWRSRSDLWSRHPLVRYVPGPLLHWDAQHANDDLGGRLLPSQVNPSASAPGPALPLDVERIREAAEWRWNVLRSLVPGHVKRMQAKSLRNAPRSRRGIAPPRRVPVQRPSSVFGPAPRSLSLIGCFRSESGLGQAARASLAALRFLGRDFSYVDTSELYPSRNGVDPGLEDRHFGAHGDVNLVHSNADELLTLSDQVFRNRMAGRFNAAMWFWETADLPERSRPALQVVDELWVASEYLVDVFGQYAKVPVHNIGLAADLPTAKEGVARSQFGLSEGEFVFLFVYDALSAHGRKNPDKALRAFVTAFAPDFRGVRFVLKVSNLNKFPAAQRVLKGLAAQYPAITIIDEYFSRGQVMDLMTVADVYVSLHAAEGFGLTLLEAMALGTPVIATAYSGNMDFTTTENSWLVDYRMMATTGATGPYPPGSVWASPNTDSAADLMRSARDNPAEVERKRALATRDALQTASLERYAARLDAHLQRVQA